MANPEMDVDSDDADEFYFESDHIALKENKDYRLLLKTILTLEVQRTQGIQDIDKIQEMQKTALEDPIAFVEKLNKGEDLGIPPPMKIKELPQIDWSKYQHVMPKEISRPFTRTKKTVQTRPAETTLNAEDSTSDDGSKVLIRGRAFDDSKPETFNQLWTPDEQKRLEELLVEFPLEEVESRRWKKIAEALGNRTTKQVQSRVQKYFKKLHSAGLPVPGRIPRMNVDMMRKGHKHQRHNYLLQKPSTFFPALDPPVLMRDETEDDCSFNSNTEESQGPSERPKSTIIPQPTVTAIPVSNYAQLLKMIVKAKNCASSNELQDGYSCDGCGEDPLQGTRWHCQDCGTNKISYDLCSDCLASSVLHESGASHTNTPPIYFPPQHTVYHHFCPIQKQPQPIVSNPNASSWDPDYLASSSSYNYLDPNFMPD
ncbi:hypothetical protein B566_EDAN003987 [Ephemera danica]|nr:hypothetical protein B566_EDAN003987 [Ephemera danica]